MKFKPGTYVTSELIDGGVLQIGDGYRAKNTELASLGIPFARAGNINNGFLFDDADLFPIKDLSKVGDKTSRVFDSVFTSKGTVGRIAYVREGTQKFVYSPQLCYWRSLDFEEIDPRFMNFWMNGSEFKSQIDYLKGQTDMADYVSLRDQRKMTFTLPDIAVQRDIVRILGDLDDKIELNRQINQTLEQIAQTLFKSWFVDFEPVKAKIEAKAAGRDPERAAMCAISGKLEPELDQLPPEQYQQLSATAAVFSDELVESELGMIPEGWEVKSLPNAIEVNPSRTLKKGAVAPYLDMANVPTNSARVADVIQREFSSGSKFMNGDTLLARITPCLENGKTAYVDFLPEKQVGWGSTEFIVFRPKAPLPEAFGYLLCRHPDFRAFAIANMSGTSGRQRVPNDCFANYKLAIPSSGVASAFGETVTGIMDGIKTRDEESRTLATIRDTLLPKLLSGGLSADNLPQEAME